MKFLLAAIAAMVVPVAVLMAFLRDWDSLRALGFVVVAVALLVGAARFWRSFLLQPPRWIAPLTRFPWVWALGGVLLLGMGARAAVLRDWLGVAMYWGAPVGTAALVVTYLYLRMWWWRSRQPPKHPDHYMAIRIVWDAYYPQAQPPWPTVVYRWGQETFWAPMAMYGWRRVYGLNPAPGFVVVAVKDRDTKLSSTAFAHELYHCVVGDAGHRDEHNWYAGDGAVERARAALIEAGL